MDEHRDGVTSKSEEGTSPASSHKRSRLYVGTKIDAGRATGTAQSIIPLTGSPELRSWDYATAANYRFENLKKVGTMLEENV